MGKRKKLPVPPSVERPFCRYCPRCKGRSIYLERLNGLDDAACFMCGFRYTAAPGESLMLT